MRAHPFFAHAQHPCDRGSVDVTAVWLAPDQLGNPLGKELKIVGMTAGERCLLLACHSTYEEGRRRKVAPSRVPERASRILARAFFRCLLTLE
jgi:hypothetical protein